MTSPSQLNSFGERHDEGDELADESRKCEVPTPKQDGVEDLSVVRTTPPRVIKEGHCEQNHHRTKHDT